MIKILFIILIYSSSLWQINFKLESDNMKIISDNFIINNKNMEFKIKRYYEIFSMNSNIILNKELNFYNNDNNNKTSLSNDYILSENSYNDTDFFYINGYYKNNFHNDTYNKKIFDSHILFNDIKEIELIYLVYLIWLILWFWVQVAILVYFLKNK